jgi:hypothetical protein
MGLMLRRVVLALAGLMVLVVLGSPAGASAAGDVNQAACPLETESSPGFRAYLPDCRAYEAVTPPYKEGGILELGGAALSADGTHVITQVAGTFAGAGNDWWHGGLIGAFYEFTRSGSGWQVTALTPPASSYPDSTFLAVSPEDFGETLWTLTTGKLLSHQDIYLRNGNGEFSSVGPGSGPAVASKELGFGARLAFAGASHDLTRELFSIQASAEGLSSLWPGDTTDRQAPSLYEYVYAGQPSAEPSLVGVKNQAALRSNVEAQLISSCGTQLGSADSAYNAVSENGESVFFTALHSDSLRECSTPSVNELYARLGAANTVSISEPAKADCEVCDTASEPKDASFQGASADGRKAYFLTEQALLTGHEGMNLYEYDFDGPAAGPAHPAGKIAVLSGGSADPRVQGVVRISQDGSHVYFVAKGMLTGQNAEGHTPEDGAENLYVYEPDPAAQGAYHTVFVATLLSPGEEATLRSEEEEEASTVNERAEKAAVNAEEEALRRGVSFLEALGIAQGVQIKQQELLTGTLGPSGTLATDTSVWGSGDFRSAQATRNGRFLLFLSSARLTAEDQSSVPQLFEYDAEHEKLTRVSIGQGASFGNDGNVSTFHDAPRIPRQSYGSGVPPAGPAGLALSEDGSRVFFTSAASLVPQAQSGSASVYEYREGNVYLLSDGLDAAEAEHSPAVRLVGADPSGRDAFFLTANPLLPQNPGGQVGLYDAREGGGFAAGASVAGCTGEACRGGLGSAPQLPAAGSVGQSAGGNLLAPAPAPAATPRKSARALRLTKALRVCRSKPKKRRGACELAARRKYGGSQTGKSRRGSARATKPAMRRQG